MEAGTKVKSWAKRRQGLFPKPKVASNEYNDLRAHALEAACVSASYVTPYEIARLEGLGKRPVCGVGPQ